MSVMLKMTKLALCSQSHAHTVPFQCWYNFPCGIFLCNCIFFFLCVCAGWCHGWSDRPCSCLHANRPAMICSSQMPKESCLAKCMTLNWHYIYENVILRSNRGIRRTEDNHSSVYWSQSFFPETRLQRRCRVCPTGCVKFAMWPWRCNFASSWQMLSSMSTALSIPLFPVSQYWHTHFH